MASAGKWTLGLLLLVVGAVLVARTVATDPASRARPVLPSAETVAKTEDKKDKAPPPPATDVACKKACIEVNEVANDAVTTAKLAPGSVTLSKLAFEVPNLNELTNEINARKAAEAASKAAAAEARAALDDAAAAAAKNDAAITAAAQNGLVAEAAARNAAVEDITKKFTAGDADLLGRLNKEMADRAAGDDTLQLKLNIEIADRAGALANLRGELANPNQVDAPIIKINNNEIVGDAVTSDKIGDGEVKTSDIADLNVTTQKLRNSAVTTEKIADLNVTTQKLRNDAVTTEKIVNGAVTFDKLDGSTKGRINALEKGLADEIVNRIADVDAEELARINADDALQTALNTEIAAREAGDSALQTALNTEIADREAGDSALQTALNTEITDRQAGDAAQAAALSAFRDQLRAPDPNPGANSAPNDGDGFVDWTNLENVPDDVINGSNNLNSFKNDLKTGDGSDPNTGDNLVSWQNLTDVPALVLDRTAADVVCATGCVSSDEISGTIDASKLSGGITGTLISDGTIMADDLAGTYDGGGVETVVGAVTSEKIADGTIASRDIGPGEVRGALAPSPVDAAEALSGGDIGVRTITALNLAPDAVTTAQIADGTITRLDLAAGAVTTDRQTSNAAVGMNTGTFLTDGGQAAVVTTIINVPSPASDHNVLLTGQATLSCTGCAAGVIVNYAIAEGMTPVAISQILTATVDTASGKIVLPVSLVQRATPGDHTYQIVVTATGIGNGGTVQVNSATLNAVDLGRVPPPSP